MSRRMAYESRRQLHLQRVSLSKKLSGLTDRFPVIAGIMSKVRAKKARNTFVVFGAMALLLLVVYLLR